MAKLTFSIATLITLSLAGCATPNASDRYRSVLAKGGLVQSDSIARRMGEAAGGASCQSTAEQDERLRKDYLETLDACRFVLSGYEADSIEAKKQKRTFMIVGAIAGSVVVPALAAGNAAKSAIAGWGGLSGVMNVASHTMESEGLDAAYFLGTRESVRASLAEGIKKFVDQSSDYCVRRKAVEEMAGACTAYTTYMPPEKN